MTIELPKGTDFQRAVWAELLKIPRGQVVSYSDIAERIGKPKAVRAVGSAVGANPKAPEIPCHRVVPKAFLQGDLGKPGGYSAPGGLAAKIKLLKDEGAL